MPRFWLKAIYLYIDVTMVHLHPFINTSSKKPFPTHYRNHSPETMVFVKLKCPPELRKAIIAVSAKPSSPTISINDTSDNQEGKEQFKFCISLRIAETTRPGQPITICTDGSVFELSHPDGGLDTLAKKTAILSSTSDSSRRINLGMFMVHHARPDPPLSHDLKERPSTQLLTIPAEGEVVITHDLPLARMFKHEDLLKPTDIVDETWRLTMAGGAIGTSWWCWGGLEGELEDRRLSAWREGLNYQSTPKPMGDEWVVGRDPRELVFEDQTEDASFRFVQ